MFIAPRTDVTVELVDAYLDQYPRPTIENAARHFGCSVGTIHNRLRKSQIIVNKPNVAGASFADRLKAAQIQVGYKGGRGGNNPNRNLVLDKKSGIWRCYKSVDGERHTIFSNGGRDVRAARQLRDKIFAEMGI